VIRATDVEKILYGSRVSSKKKLWTISALTLVCASLAAQTAAVAQTDSTAVSTPKQTAAAQKTADRKAMRAKKNAELGTLEKNGYNPTSNELDYPQDLQSAETKASRAKAAAMP
jgi:hypothetical protein